jgi:hypothetical protein
MWPPSGTIHGHIVARCRKGWLACRPNSMGGVGKPRKFPASREGMIACLARGIESRRRTGTVPVRFGNVRRA